MLYTFERTLYSMEFILLHACKEQKSCIGFSRYNFFFLFSPKFKIILHQQNFAHLRLKNNECSKHKIIKNFICVLTSSLLLLLISYNCNYILLLLEWQNFVDKRSNYLDIELIKRIIYTHGKRRGLWVTVNRK